MANTVERQGTPAAGPETRAETQPPMVAIAVQGSFGHLPYAAGILDAIRAHNASAHRAIEFRAASGCVEMMSPLWLFLADPSGRTSIREPIVDDDATASPWAKIRIAPPVVRPDAWRSYFGGLIGAQRRWARACAELLVESASGQDMHEAAHSPAGAPSASPRCAVGGPTGATAEVIAAMQDLWMYSSGLPGQIAFNPLFIAERHAGLEALCRKSTGPTIFTNATRAEDLGEIYLYTGSDPSPAQLQRLRGKRAKRAVLRLTPDYFFASGARPPYILPIPVTVNGRTERWMEGAMRCNPPLTPLIDMGATHIVLLRFFCKDAREEPNNNGELNERFVDAIFNIPLQKEIESIEFNSQVAACISALPGGARASTGLPDRRPITLLDPGDAGNPAHCPAYIAFLNDELGALSHWDGLTHRRRGDMFDRGAEIGVELIRHLKPLLP